MGRLSLEFVVSKRFVAWPIFGVIVIEGRSRVAKILHILFCKIFIAAHIPRVANISENLR